MRVCLPTRWQSPLPSLDVAARELRARLDDPLRCAEACRLLAALSTEFPTLAAIRNVGAKHRSVAATSETEALLLAIAELDCVRLAVTSTPVRMSWLVMAAFDLVTPTNTARAAE
jgi:hypothetical protein